MLFLMCITQVVGERGDTKDGVCEALEEVFGQFPKRHLKILLRIVKAMLERENIFKPTVWNPNLYETTNDGGVG
jgi:uncharacterized Fe-S radical SAM superfamily protein PflX